MYKILPVILFASFGLFGCSASNCDVEVYLDPELKNSFGQIPTLEVDIAGVNAIQAQRLQKINLDTYFTPNSPQRKSISPITLTFSEEQPGPLTIDDDNDLWEQWEERGAQFIAVICNLPNFFSLEEEAPSSQQDASLAGEMAEMANENAAVFNNGRVLLINMHDGFLKDTSTHIVQVSVDGLITLSEEPSQYLQIETVQSVANNVKSVQDLVNIEQQNQAAQLSEMSAN